MSVIYSKKNQFDAIVVGSGISGGWAAKELCEAGLKTLVLERGRMVKHIQYYPTMNNDPWDLPHNCKTPNEIIEKHYSKQKRWGFDENIDTFIIKIPSTIMMR